MGEKVKEGKRRRGKEKKELREKVKEGKRRRGKEEERIEREG